MSFSLTKKTNIMVLSLLIKPAAFILFLLDIIYIGLKYKSP